MICPRCGGTMQQKEMPYVTKGKGREKDNLDKSHLVWFCRDCMVSATIR